MSSLISPANPRVKLARQLQRDRNAREEQRLFVAEGAKLVSDLISCGLPVEFVLFSPNETGYTWHKAHPHVLSFELADGLMRDISAEVTPPGVLAIFKMPKSMDTTLIATAQLTSAPILILDQLRDPGNMGACLRVAAGAGCQTVLLSPGCVDAYNPKVLRGGMGAHGRLQLCAAAWPQIATICQPRPIYATTVTDGSQAYDAVNWTQAAALIIGSEADGISADAQKISTGAVHIPMANHVESLNAAVACGIVLFEAARQNRIKTAL